MKQKVDTFFIHSIAKIQVIFITYKKSLVLEWIMLFLTLFFNV